MPVREKLTADKIAQNALDLLDADGLAGFSMRKLAARLGVDPMAIYHYHNNKDALIYAVLNEMLSRCVIPSSGGSWQGELRELCQGLRTLAKVHPGAFRIYETYERWLPAEHQLHEAFYDTLSRAGFDPRQIARLAHLLLSYTESFAVDEITGWLNLDQEPEYHASIAQGSYPTLNRLKSQAGLADPDADFALGLRVLIQGLERELT